MVARKMPQIKVEAKRTGRFVFMVMVRKKSHPAGRESKQKLLRNSFKKNAFFLSDLQAGC